MNMLLCLTYEELKLCSLDLLFAEVDKVDSLPMRELKLFQRPW